MDLFKAMILSSIACGLLSFVMAYFAAPEALSTPGIFSLLTFIFGALSFVALGLAVILTVIKKQKKINR